MNEPIAIEVTSQTATIQTTAERYHRDMLSLDAIAKRYDPNGDRTHALMAEIQNEAIDHAHRYAAALGNDAVTHVRKYYVPFASQAEWDARTPPELYTPRIPADVRDMLMRAHDLLRNEIPRDVEMPNLTAKIDAIQNELAAMIDAD